jgi:hypothetical protein
LGSSPGYQANPILSGIPNAAEEASSTTLRPWHQPPSRFVSSSAMFRDRMSAPTHSPGLIGGQRGWVTFLGVSGRFGCSPTTTPSSQAKASDAGRSVARMATDEEIRSDLIGDSGTGVSRALVLAVKSLTEWPVDAFFVDVGDDREMVGWIQGNLVGVVSAEGAGDKGEVRGNLYHLSRVQAVRVSVNVVEDGMRLRANRGVTVVFGLDDELSVDIGAFRNKHYQNRADEFISTLVLRLAGLQASS